MQNTAALADWLTRIREELLSVVASMPPEQWRESPPDGGWSAAEVIAHLMQTESAIQNGMKRVFAAEPRPVPLWKRWYLPPAIQQWRLQKASTPIPLDPALLDEKDKMLSQFRTLHDGAIQILEDNRGRDLGRWRFRHPFFGMLDGYTWFRFIGYHEVRHTKQLREIANALK